MGLVGHLMAILDIPLWYMHLRPRLEELFGGEDWFGCRNVMFVSLMFVGDILQLQPVSGNPMDEKITKKRL